MFTETNLATNIAEAYYGYYEKSYTGVAPVSNENWTGGVATSVIKSAALDNLAAATKTIIPKYIQEKREVDRRGAPGPGISVGEPIKYSAQSRSS